MEEGQGAVGPAICAADVPAAEMACRVDPGTSVLEGSNILANWAMDISGAVDRGSSNKAGEAEVMGLAYLVSPIFVLVGTIFCFGWPNSI